MDQIPTLKGEGYVRPQITENDASVLLEEDEHLVTSKQKFPHKTVATEAITHNKRRDI